MESFDYNPYSLIISASTIIILSFLYNAISKKVNVPDAFLLIITGVIIRQGMGVFELKNLYIQSITEVLSIVGLIMIILESTLNLEFQKKHLATIGRAFLMALIGTLGMAVAITPIFYYMLDTMQNFKISLLYALPLSILSTSVLTYVRNLSEDRRMFYKYESAFSNIIGITSFFFLHDSLLTSQSVFDDSLGLSKNLILTIITSLIVSYTLIFLLQNVKSNVRLFPLISVVLLLYAIGQLLELSSLTIILIFGMVLSNGHLLLKSYLGKYINSNALSEIKNAFSVVTVEGDFVVRTFLFVIFGLSITISFLYDPYILLVSLLVLLLLYGLRYVLLQIFMREGITSQVRISPRGVISILLFFTIPAELKTDAFSMEIIFHVISISGLLTTYALYTEKRRRIDIHAHDDHDLIAPIDSIYKGFHYDSAISTPSSHQERSEE